jgi:Mg-chelatase subunit ChlD
MNFMKPLLFGLILAFSTSLFAQEFSQTSFDLGEISQLNEDVVEINLANYTNENIFILRIDKPIEMDVKYRSKSIPSNQATLLRFKINPKEKGKFKVDVNIYLSHLDEPQEITFSGEVKVLPKNNLQDCPSFSSADMAQKSLQAFQKQNASPIKRLYVIIGNREEIAEVKDSIKDIQNSSQIIHASVIAELGSKQEDPIESKEGKMLVEEAKVAEIATPITTKNPIEEIQDSLLGSEFIPNNIVFLIDASTSMREEDKMALLQKTMIELLKPLRSIDYLSIVSYSGEATVILKPTSAIAKKDIEDIIMNIQADGSTNAVKGIKKAIEVSKSNFLENGNNQIILSSDGAFDIGERNVGLRNKIEQNAKQGINITVLGIKNERWTNKSLKEIADLGGGELLHCRSEKDTKNVLEAVKEQALK